MILRRRWRFLAGQSCDGALRRREWVFGRWMVAAPRVCQAGQHAGKHVDEREHQQDGAREKYQQIDADAEENDPAEGLAAGEVDLFAAPEAPGADHEEADEAA